MAGRERNPERSRERILQAARAEFARHGLAGARVEAIAQRAGLNKQLISHHFGGKAALYRAVMAEGRLRPGGELAEAPDAMPGALVSFFERAQLDQEWIRVLLWEALETPLEAGAAAGDAVGAAGAAGAVGAAAVERDGSAAVAADAVFEARRRRYAERVAWVRAEQGAGRLPSDLDPAMLLLSLLGAALYPVLLPELCVLVTGHRPDDEAFTEQYSQHLRRLAARFER